MKRSTSAARAMIVAASIAMGGCASNDLVSAIDEGDAVAIRRLAEGASIEARSPRGQTALSRASELGRIRIVSELLARGARTDAVDGDGATALHWAVRGGHKAIVNTLLRAGVDREAKAGPLRRSALFDAVIAGTEDAVDALLLGGADPNARDAYDETPLHALARTDAWRIQLLFPKLVDAGADAFARDARGFTPLHTAATRDALDVAEEYAKRSLRLDVETPLGETAREVAHRYRSDRVEQFLFERDLGGARNCPPPLYDAARKNDVARVLALLAEGADPSRAYSGQRALEAAEENHADEAAKLLRERTQEPR